MTSRVSRAVSALLAICVVCPAATAELRSDQVLVVANANSPESVQLATLYAKIRMIPPRNIVTVATTTAEGISRDAYVKEIVDPIKQTMVERRIQQSIRCVCLMWQIPVFIQEDKSVSDETQQLLGYYKETEEKARQRIAEIYQYLDTVNVDFPKPKGNSLLPLENHFNPLAKKPQPRSEDWETLRKLVTDRFIKKSIGVRVLFDTKKREIATTQMMAVALELKGLVGLLNYLEDARITAGPPLQAVREQIVAAEKVHRSLLVKPHIQEVAQARLNVKMQLGGAFQVLKYCIAAQRVTGKPVGRRKGPLGKNGASVDSELSLLWWPDANRRVIGMRRNPLCWQNDEDVVGKRLPPTLMTARIDGPSYEVARRLITDSVAVQKTGLKGTFYIDAGLVPRFAGETNNRGYKEYDNKLLDLEQFLVQNTRLNVVTDKGPQLMGQGKPGSCDNAALYVGWYSLRNYIPAFKWNPGAVGWHTASFEAESLRDPKATQWCPQMLLNGVSGTIGAVAEPTLAAFPEPKSFFSLLLTGRYTIAECYWRTTPMVSWQMTLIADPLYNPYEANPQLDLHRLPTGLQPR